MKKWLIVLLCVALCCQGPVRKGSARESGPVAAASPAASDGSSAVPTSLPAPAPTVTQAPADTPTPAPADTPEPTPAPTDTPTPEPTCTPDPTPTPHRLMVALTFDDGPNPEKTGPILDFLEECHGKATFFVLGTSINDKTSPLLQRMVDMGCEIGIHGLDHRRIDVVSPKNLEKHLRQMSAIISERIEGGYTPRLMRPPGGHYSESVGTVAKEVGLAVILWSVDTLDWKVNQDEVLLRLNNLTKDGAIILCHDKGHGTLKALQTFVPQLLEQGYELVTVSELIARNGASVQPGGIYYSVDP